jgi:hypothetical protein
MLITRGAPVRGSRATWTTVAPVKRLAGPLPPSYRRPGRCTTIGPRILEESPRYDSAVQTRRPMHFFRPDGPMPDEVEMRLTIPPELGPEAELLAELRERVHAVEAEYEAERQWTGRQQYSDSAPCSSNRAARIRPPRSRGEISGHGSLAGASGQGSRRFCATARSSKSMHALREAWREGRGVAFPLGTYWLRRFANVVVAEA